MTDTFEWRGRVGEAWAEEWRRTDRTLAPVNEALVAAIAGQAAAFEAPGILDVGCGAGATSLALAERIEGAQVTGIDLSAPLVAAASKSPTRGAGPRRIASISSSRVTA
jgi:2-polyprenyl-3-methyl-5-hydroxy-6-metoxy-1,4-benzoquinol methylase